MNLIFNDKWQGESDPPSGSSGHDDRKRVSWNARCAKSDTSSVDTRGDLYDTVETQLGGKK